MFNVSYYVEYLASVCYDKINHNLKEKSYNKKLNKNSDKDLNDQNEIKRMSLTEGTLIMSKD